MKLEEKGKIIQENAISNGWAFVSYDKNTFLIRFKKETWTVGVYLTKLTVQMVNESLPWKERQRFSKDCELEHVLEMYQDLTVLENVFQTS